VPSLPAPETAVTEPVAEAAADAAADAAPTAEPVAETAGDAAPVEAAASTDGEPDAGGESVKDARRRKIGRRASANKTSRR
jgi:hypothetical protein